MNKRGQGVAGKIVLGLIVAIVVLIGIVSLYTYNNQGRMGYGDALADSVESVTDGIMKVGEPIFRGLLGLDNAENDGTKFLMIISFILFAIILIGAIDATNIFGDSNQEGVLNAVVGIIVAIIGVRFMPQGLWGTLTAPSSALMITLLLAAPFMALLYLSTRNFSIFRFTIGRKIIWLAFIIFLSYLIFFPEVETSRSLQFRWVYLIFLILSIVMLFFDSTVRNYYYKEKAKTTLEDAKHKKGILQRKALRDQMKEWQAVMVDPDASKDARNEARKMISELQGLSKETV